MSDMCTDNRFELIEKYKKELVEGTNIETSPEEMQVLDNILFRFWQMGWLDSIDRMLLVKESAGTLMHSVGDSVVAKALRNAGRFIQNAIDGEVPEFEKIPSVKTERKNGKWIQDGHHIQCNQCGISICDKDREGDVLPKNFCPNCGSYNGGDENHENSHTV